MYVPSIGNQAYTIAVWMFADWFSRYGRIMVTDPPDDSPPKWTSDDWRMAATLERCIRKCGYDDNDPELIATREATSEHIRDWVRDKDEGLCRSDDGVLRRFPDQLLNFMTDTFSDVHLDATVAMADASDIVQKLGR